MIPVTVQCDFDHGGEECHATQLDTQYVLVLSTGLEWDSTVVAINGEVNASCEHNYESN